MIQRPEPAALRPGETLGACRQTDSRERARRQDGAWAAAQVATLPASWQRLLLDRWGVAHGADAAGANLAHLAECTKIAAAERAGIPADASDAELVQIAKDTARDMARRIAQRELIAREEAADAGLPEPERFVLLAKFAEGLHWLDLRGIVRKWRGPIDPALRRMCCDRWWRAVLRRVHAQAVESTARRIGLVHKRAGCYISDDGLKRRTAQHARNARVLESVEAVNERAQRYTLAELAAKGPANREIRRHELMTRIAGFELIARECGHEALFVTVTCPSRMHAWRTKPGRAWSVERNPLHDGTTPDKAQQHLAKQWQQFRSAATREGLGEYGFRIAEPNHDGTPHWHALIFFPPATAKGKPAAERARELLTHYFLTKCDPGEQGAAKHRVTVEAIDWTKGSAAGYVAKYVAKNIDGYKVEKDLYGNDCMTASRRVDAWASTWRIRQFQQIGGAPVGVWRELRRTHPEQGQHSLLLARALSAVNGAAWKAKQVRQEAVERYTAAHGWRDYLLAQGGHRVKRRDLRLRVLREATGEVGRYGEPMPPAVVGVTLAEEVLERRPALGIVPATNVRRLLVEDVESERSAWIVVAKGAAAPPDLPARGEAARPWSPVNNCTHEHPERLFRPRVQRHRKVGRWADWSKFHRPNPPPSG